MQWWGWIGVWVMCLIISIGSLQYLFEDNNWFSHDARLIISHLTGIAITIIISAIVHAHI